MQAWSHSLWPNTKKRIAKQFSSLLLWVSSKLYWSSASCEIYASSPLSACNIQIEIFGQWNFGSSSILPPSKNTKVQLVTTARSLLPLHLDYYKHQGAGFLYIKFNKIKFACNRYPLTLAKTAWQHRAVPQSDYDRPALAALTVAGSRARKWQINSPIKAHKYLFKLAGQYLKSVGQRAQSVLMPKQQEVLHSRMVMVQHKYCQWSQYCSWL